MSTMPVSREELLQLATAHVAGDLDKGSAQRLAAALTEDATARQLFIEYMDLHSALAWESSSAADLFSPMVNTAELAAACPRANFPQRVARYFVATPKRIALSVATIVVALFLIIMASTPVALLNRIHWVSRDEQRVLAARVSAAMECRWDKSDTPVLRDAPLYPGDRLRLREGVVELTFINGARVTLSGPASLVVESPTRGTLETGKIAARVEKEARGFTIRTPGATIVDLGTEFGVSVPPRDEQSGNLLGHEELHVFSGEVEVTFVNDAVAPQRLLTGQALRFASRAATQAEDGGIERLAASQRARFPQPISADGQLTTAAPLPPEHWPPVTRGLTVWLAADGAMRCTSDGRVAVWEDMLAGEQRQVHDARQRFSQRRPRLIADAFASRPAVRFDGDDYLALPTPPQLGISGQPYEMFIVARSSSPGIQFLIGGGTEEFELHLNGDAGVRFIPAGYFGGEGASDLGTAGAFSDGQPHVFHARLLPDDNFRGVVEVDGRVASDLTMADSRAFSDLGMQLGVRHDRSFGLVGEIAEVLIFRDALSGGEHHQIVTYLTRKYRTSSTEFHQP